MILLSFSKLRCSNDINFFKFHNFITILVYNYQRNSNMYMKYSNKNRRNASFALLDRV